MAGEWTWWKGRPTKLAGQAYLLENRVTHTRFLPAPSKHSFVYPTVSLLVSLNALEDNELDLWRGWLFGYGGVRGRITGLRASGYLYDSPTDNRSIRQKLVDVLDQNGHSGRELHDAWFMTMPSFLGVEGINPLSVYFCYRHGNPSLWLVVLEVHNTFGERHVYVLDTDKSEPTPPGRFGFQWTFPRQFHVSPFNDRSGYYLCQLVAPSRPPSPLEDPPLSRPRPVVKITLLTASANPQRKLVAILRATYSAPLSTTSLLSALAYAPLGLLSALPRIVYQAYILHYKKRLDVYQRPEPYAFDAVVESHLPAVPNAAQKTTCSVGCGVGWQKKGPLERWCERRAYAFLRNRCPETGISVTFVSANPAEEQVTISSSGENNDHKDGHVLTIYHRSPRVFAVLFMMPSPGHGLLLGSEAEKVFSVSSEELFNDLFAPPPPASRRQPWLTRSASHIRGALVPNSLNLSIPLCHALDNPVTFTSLAILSILYILARIEEKLFNAFGARFVPGEEPWGGWARLGSNASSRPWGTLGSVRREKDM